jgi:hypothetical protein
MMKESDLLVLDAAVNLAAGGLLVLFPRSVISALGLPMVDVPFYPSLLGGVLLGIGLALLLERFRAEQVSPGLGVNGAVLINIAGAGVLIVWLVAGDLVLPLRGYVVLWGIALVVLAIGGIELREGLWRR